MGTVVGLALLLPAYAIGGMGAGDVKLLAGVGAWVWATTTLYAFCVSAIVGGAIALADGALAARLAPPHLPVLDDRQRNFGGPRPQRAGRDGRRAKSAMLLLPYGIPIAIGSIAYFVWAGMLP